MTLDELAGMWYILPRELPGGERYAAIELLALGQGRIIIGRFDDEGSWELGFCYESLGMAIEAILEWDGARGTEPDGWVRAVGFAGGIRRRPGADRHREYLDDGSINSRVLYGWEPRGAV